MPKRCSARMSCPAPRFPWLLDSGSWLLSLAIGYWLLAIPLHSPVFFPEILNPILRLGRLTGDTSHEIIGQITAAVPGDLVRSQSRSGRYSPRTHESLRPA